MDSQLNEWQFLENFDQRFGFRQGQPEFWPHIHEVESRAGYPEKSDQSTFWGFFIYILLLNVKQLLSIV